MCFAVYPPTANRPAQLDANWQKAVDLYTVMNKMNSYIDLFIRHPARILEGREPDSGSQHQKGIQGCHPGKIVKNVHAILVNYIASVAYKSLILRSSKFFFFLNLIETKIFPTVYKNTGNYNLLIFVFNK